MGALERQVAIVTGAGSGMAKATALRFAAEGAYVIAGDISGEEEQTAKEGGGNITPFNCDVTEPTQVQAMVAAATDRYGRLDMMCNVAGITTRHQTALADEDPDDWDHVMNVNLKGVFLGTKHAARVMVGQGSGSILNWSSIGGLVATGIIPSYSASKAGVIHLTRNAAVEYGRFGIRVNCICPGYIETPMLAKGFIGQPPEAIASAKAALESKAVLGRGGRPEEIADAALWLSSSGASFVTGAILPVDGGWSVRAY